MKTCSRCELEKKTDEFFTDDRGTYWCKLCVLQFLEAHGKDEIYEDAREFCAPQLRLQPRSAAWAVRSLRNEIKAGGSALTFAENKLQGARFDTATRLKGQRALLCEACNEKFGGKEVFKAHRKYGTVKGRPAKDAVLKCYSLENTKYEKDLVGVWRDEFKNLPVRKI